VDLLIVTMIGLAAGVLGTGLGGLLSVLLRDGTRLSFSYLLGFAGGVMLAVVFYDMLPEALEMGGFLYGIFGLVVGMFLLMGLDHYLPHAHLSPRDFNGRLLRAGLLLGIGMAMHNLPEGIAIGAGFAYSTELGVRLALVIGLHNLPEGMALGVPLAVAGIARPLVVLYAVLAGVPVGIGTFFGHWFGTMSESALAFSLALAAGAMLYIIAAELLPSARQHAKGQESMVGVLLGVIVGLSLSLLAH